MITDELREAETAVYRAANALWISTGRPIDNHVIDQVAEVTDAMGKLTTEFCGHLPGSSRREHADALEWVAQRYQGASEGLRAISASLAGQETPEPPRGPIKMSTGGTLTPAPERVVLTLAMLHELAKARFGSDPKRWRFVCPACKSETAVGDFAELAPNGQPGQECIGREVKGMGCDHAAYGPIPLAPWIVIVPSGRNVLSFALAEVDPHPDSDSNTGQEVLHEGESSADVAGS